MWIVAPTPETTSSIVLLNWSSVKPIGTLKAPPMSIQVNATAAIPDCLKIKQLHAKLTKTAATEIKQLTVFDRRVNSVMKIALANGTSRMIHGSVEFIGSLKFQAANVFDIGCLARPVECNENRQTHSGFRRRDRDDEEDEHLHIVVRQTA